MRTRKVRSVDRTLAFSICGLLLFLPANLFPIMTFEVVGRSNDNRLVSGVFGMFRDGEHIVAGMILATSILAPFARFAAAVAVTLPIRLGRPEKSSRAMQRFLRGLDRWAMLDVYLLAIVVAYAKLSNFGNVYFQGGWYPLLGIILLSIAVSVTYDPDTVRELTSPQPPSDAEHEKRRSLVVTEALLLTSMILYVPSYAYPVLNIVEYGKVDHDTVYGSILELTSGGQYLLGALVLLASMVVPTMKILTLAVLTLSVRLGVKYRKTDRLLLYRIVEAIGRWSFVDLFVGSILIALAELGVFATVTPGPGLIFFAGVVLSTMLAAMAFDPRLIWDAAKD